MMTLDYKMTDDGCLVLEIKGNEEKLVLFFEKESKLSFWARQEKGSDIRAGGVIPTEFIDLLREQLKEEQK